jgi:group II intron reverse transcriptase/maturase
VSEPKPKPFDISKWAVWEAYRRVKANKGAAGVDEQSIEEFEQDLSGNLFKLWNRLSSGSYFPPPVRAVEIPKKDGGLRVLGVPTVADRIAQVVVRSYLEPSVEPVFHPDSYGYRPGRSAHDALGVCRERCWRNDWVLDLDIRKFFDNVPWDLVLKAVAHHTDQKWILLYVERWLKAPLQREDGMLVERDRGTPQGSAISPLLANMFMHHAFDAWMGREFPDVPFERYCDDIIVHARSERQALHVRAVIASRLADLRVRAQRAQDPHRVLQGRGSARLLRAHVVHVSGVYVPPATVEEPVREALPELLSGSLERREDRDAARDAPLAAAPSPRQDPHGPGAHVQHRAPGLDQLLRTLLQVHVVSGLPPPQRHAGEVGHEEIQTLAAPPDQGTQVRR